MLPRKIFLCQVGVAAVAVAVGVTGALAATQKVPAVCGKGGTVSRYRKVHKEECRRGYVCFLLATILNNTRGTYHVSWMHAWGSVCEAYVVGLNLVPMWELSQKG